jgi:GTP-binding protein LepA
MIFDSVFNSFRGIEIYFRVLTAPSEREKDQVLGTNNEYGVDEIGF